MYLIPVTLKYETKIFKRLYMKDLIYIGIIIAIAFFLKNSVHAYLQIPYWLFMIALSFYFVTKPKDNPNKRKVNALLMFIMRDNNIYYSIDKGAPYEYNE